MGPQQVLRAAASVALALAATLASAAPRPGERVAVIDLGPTDGQARHQLGVALVKAGLVPLAGDGVEDALAGIDRDQDSLGLAAAMADAQSRFGALACADTVRSARAAIELAAGRQASGLAVPELPRAWTYVLLCADRASDQRAATQAAAALRALGGAADVDPGLLARYPEVDTLGGREVMSLEIDTEVPGAEVWIDFQRAGTAPLRVDLNAGSHVIAAGAKARRGVLVGTVVASQRRVTVPMPDRGGPWARLAARVTSWAGAVPPGAELAAVLDDLGVRVAIVRHGSTIEAWGHAGRTEPLRRLGDDDGQRALVEADALAALIADRLAAWSDRAPDPDRPLLVETPEERRQRRRGRGDDDDEEPTAWWVYATIAGALLTGAAIIYAQESRSDTQRVELRYP